MSHSDPLNGENSTIRLFGACALFFLNFALLLSFALGLHRLFAYDNNDLSVGMSLFASFIGFAALKQHSSLLVFGSHVDFLVEIVKKRVVIVVVNLACLLFVAVLWLFIIPYASEANFKQGKIAYVNEQYALALRLYGKSLFQQPHLANRHLAIARVYEALTSRAKAIEHYELGMVTEDQTYTAYNNLARLYIAEDRPQKALTLLMIVMPKIEVDTAHGQHLEELKGVVYKNMAWAALHLGLYEDALEYVNSAHAHLAKIPDTVEKYPAVYCLYTLISKPLNITAKVDMAKHQCINSRSLLLDEEMQLYVDVRKLSSLKI